MTVSYSLRKGGSNTLYIATRVRPFTQPVLTENGTLGGDAFGCDQESYVQFGEKIQKFFSAFSDKNYGWRIEKVDTSRFYWGKFYNPNGLILSEITIYNTASGIYAPDQVRLYGSNDNVTWTLIGEHATWPATDTTPIVLPLIGAQKAWKYFRVDMKPRTTTAVVLYKMKIKATEIIEYLARVNEKWEPVVPEPEPDPNPYPGFTKANLTIGQKENSFGYSDDFTVIPGKLEPTNGFTELYQGTRNVNTLLDYDEPLEQFVQCTRDFYYKGIRYQNGDVVSGEGSPAEWGDQSDDSKVGQTVEVYLQDPP